MSWLEIALVVAAVLLLFAPPASYIVGIAAGAYWYGWTGAVIGFFLAYVIDTILD